MMTAERIETRRESLRAGAGRMAREQRAWCAGTLVVLLCLPFLACHTGSQPVLTIKKSHTGNVTSGQKGATYTVTVSIRV